MNVYSQCKDTIIFLNQEKKTKNYLLPFHATRMISSVFREARLALCFAQQGISMLNGLLK